MVIEAREHYKCEKDDRPVHSGRLVPTGEHRHFHAAGRKDKCYGNVKALAGAADAAKKPKKEPKPKKEGAKPRKSRAKATGASIGAMSAQDAAYAKAGINKAKTLAKNVPK